MCAFKLRPHHGVCTLFFVGKGYSEEFVEHMTAVVKALKMQESRVNLTESVDEICSACPHNKDGRGCSQKAERYDRRVLEICGFLAGEDVGSSELYSRIKEKVLANGRLAEVCGDCEWFGICSQAAREIISCR